MSFDVPGNSGLLPTDSHSLFLFYFLDIYFIYYLFYFLLLTHSLPAI